MANAVMTFAQHVSMDRWQLYLHFHFTNLYY